MKVQTARLRLIVLVLLGASLPLWLLKGETVRDTATLTLIYMMATMAWNLLGGFAGQMSFGNSIFFGIGAYSTALLSTRHDINPWIGILIGVVIAGAVGSAIALLTFRLRGLYFALTTFTLTLTAQLVVNHYSFDGGATGLIVSVGKDSLEKLSFSGPLGYFYVVFVAVLVTGGICWYIYRSRLGFMLRAIRDDEGAARASGVRSRQVKLYACVISAMLTAVAGGFYIQYIGIIDPTTGFGETLATQIVILSFVGGLGTLWGPVVGSVILVPLQQTLGTSFSGLTSGWNLVIYGGIVIFIICVDPRGLVSLWRSGATRVRDAFSRRSTLKGDATLDGYRIEDQTSRSGTGI
jgi:branched-chain amino acid transport system permease protein